MKPSINMKTCLIVDDEAPARQIIELLVDWEKIGYAPPLQANNGLAALKMCNNNAFDVILCDIQMPVMNGIELIENIKINNPNQNFAIISCHESFEFAKKAIKLGVSDYIIKDLMTKNEIESLLLSFGETLQQSTEILSEKSNALQIFCEQQFTNENELLLSLNHSNNENRLIGIYFGIPKESNSIDAFNAIINELSKNFKEVAKLSNFQGFLLLSLPKTSTTLSEITTILKQIKTMNIIKEMPHFTIGISEYEQDITATEAFSTAKEAYRMKMFLGLDKSIYYNSIKNKVTVFNVQSTYEKLNCFKMELLEKSDFSTILKDIYIIGTAGISQVNYFLYINDNIVGILLDYIRNKKIDWNNLKERNFTLNSEELNSLETVEQMREYLLKAISIIKEFETNIDDSNISQRAVHYIAQHIHEPISLADIAEDLHYNKSYLSRKFKEDTGKNILQYIIECKIEKAKEYLLENKMKISEISDLLNFSNQQYFSIIFKRETNMSPAEYKKSILK